MLKIGIDVGGTFTDLVAVDDTGRSTLAKVASTPEDPSIGVMSGLERLAEILAIPRGTLLAQTERIVPNSVIRKNPFMTTIAYADVVVEAPYGGHPYAAHGFYKEDVEFIQDYVKCSNANRKGDAKTWDSYLKRHIQEHYAYLETVGIKKLLSLYTHPIVSW